MLHSFANIYKLYPTNKIIQDYKSFLEKEISKLGKYLIEETKDLEICSFDTLENSFVPTKTAINGLNFISKKEFENLKNYEIENEIIFDFVKIIYVLLKEEYLQIKKEDLMKNLFDKILRKYNIDHISKYYQFFSQFLQKNIILFCKINVNYRNIIHRNNMYKSYDFTRSDFFYQ